MCRVVKEKKISKEHYHITTVAEFHFVPRRNEQELIWISGAIVAKNHYRPTWFRNGMFLPPNCGGREAVASHKTAAFTNHQRQYAFRKAHQSDAMRRPTTEKNCAMRKTRRKIMAMNKLEILMNNGWLWTCSRSTRESDRSRQHRRSKLSQLRCAS